MASGRLRSRSRLSLGHSDLIEEVVTQGNDSTGSKIVEALANTLTLQRRSVPEDSHDVDQELPIVRVLTDEIERALRLGQGEDVDHPDGLCLKPDAVSAAFVRRVKRAGLPRLTLKGLRHTWATLALERGIHPRVVQERLGHSTIAITLGIYSHVAPTLHDEAAHLIGSFVLEQ